jgi:hypothetical protein
MLMTSVVIHGLSMARRADSDTAVAHEYQVGAWSTSRWSGVATARSRSTESAASPDRPSATARTIDRNVSSLRCTPSVRHGN